MRFDGGAAERESKTGWTWWRTLLVVLAVSIVPMAMAQTPPLWNGGAPTKCGGNPPDCNGAAAIAPAPWPSTAQWIPYSWGTEFPDLTLADKHPIRDQRIQDPSNGGTTPQNYVNVSSGCADQSLPSIYYYYDTANDIIFFRWRVEQIANNYATGPTAGAFANTAPWNSALWTVMLDFDGNGFRDFAMHLDGSSGGPSTPVDILRSIWSNSPTNSIDYIGSSSTIHSLFTEPTAFVATVNGTEQILQFDGSAVPSTIQWPNGASETIWDYGTTRSINISTGSCEEFFVDYTIPISMLNASAFSGPTLDQWTPFQFLFTTANSLNNPFQKDVVWDGNFVCDASSPGPFGDAVQLATGIIPQPIATSISAGSAVDCNVPVTAQIMDSLTVTNCSSISELVQAQFKYWYDINGNGIADDAGGAWINIAEPTVPVGTVVTADWDIQNLIQGQYLLALEIQDSIGHTTQTWENKTTATLLEPFGVDGLGRNLYTNVPPFEPTFPFVGIQEATHGISYKRVQIGGACGAPPPTVTKTASPTNVTQGDPVTYTVTVTNTSGTVVNINSITDTLPSGFTYVSTGAGTLGAPTTSPNPGDGGTVTWTFTGVTLPATSSRTFIFTVNSGTTGGTYFNTANVFTSVGTLTGTDTTGVTVNTAALTVSKSVALASNPSVPITSASRNDVVRWTIVVTNNSQTTATGVQVQDALPTGFTYVDATPAPNSAPTVGQNGTVTWTGYTLTSGGGTQTFTIDAVATTAGSFTNTADVTSVEAAPVSASANLFVAGPILAINKVANTTVFVPPATITYTISYANVGNATANLTYLGDTVPTGFTFVPGSSSANCNINRVIDATVTAGGSGYTSTPTVTISGGSGAGATATAVLAGGAVTAITILNPGTGYTSDPTITISGGGGSGATATSVRGVACTTLGTADTLAPGVTESRTLAFSVTSAAATTSTNTASINATDAARATDTFVVTEQSNTCVTTNYQFRSTRGSVSSGSTFAVGYVSVTSGGSGFTSAPTVTFTGGGGSGATGVAVGNSTGGVAGVNITNGGTGYTTAPTVGFVGGGGSGAAATAFLTDDQYLALTTAGAAEVNIVKTVTTPAEIARFYGPVDTTTAYLLSTTASVTTSWLTSTPNGTKIKYTVTLNDFDTVANTTTLIASTGAQTENNGGTFTDPITVPANTILEANHRLLWIITVEDNNLNANTTDTFRFNGATAAAQSFGTVCLSPVTISLTKDANKLSVNTTGTDTITYTVTYNNPSSVTITNVIITDPIPAGMTFASASRSPAVGTLTTPAVNGTGNVELNLGSVAAGATGTLTITLNVLSSITGSTTTNTATLTNDYTLPVTASHTAFIASPNVLITKRASGSAYVPGDSFSYTLSVVNTGTGNAASVVVTDPIPSYFTVQQFTSSATSVAAINISSGGSGYTSAPTVSFSGDGTGAAATAVISGGVVTAVLITNGGSGYTTAPTISFSGGGGAGAAATTQLAGTLTSASSAGNNLTFNIGSLAAGATTLLNVTVQVNTTGIPAGQTPVTNTASVVDSYNATPRTSSVTVTLTANPVLTLSETATPSANRVVFADVTAGGTYTSPPTVTISGNGCAGVTAIVSTSPSAGLSSASYSVTGVTITNPGSGCTGIPTITFVGACSPCAAATATVGPAPGDTITYVLTVNNTGNADAAGVVITGTVPSSTTYTSGGTFSVGTVSSTSTTVAAGGSTQLTYVVTVDSSLPYSYSSPFGVTTLPQTGSATSTNATAPPNVNETLSTGTSPQYTMTKTPDGNTFAMPLTTVPSAIVNVTSFNVASAALINVGDYIAIPNGGSYSVVQVTAKSGSIITVSSGVTAAAGANVYAVEQYSLSYANIGGASGQNVTVTDVLPLGLLYAGTPRSSVSTISVTAGGSGYATAPTVTISGGGGSGATATATVSAGVVTSIAVTSSGSGYTSNPTVSFSGGGGSGATASAILAARVPTTAPSIGSEGTVTWSIGTVGNGSSGTVNLLAFATTAAIYTDTAIVGDGTALNTRNDYDTAQTTFGALNPSKSTTTPQVFNGTGIAHYVITVQNPFASTTAINVSVKDNLPTGFTYATGSTDINGSSASDPCSGCVAAVSVTTGGTGYTSAPTVSFTGGGGSGAAGTANVTGTIVTSVTITAAGSGYTSAPTVSFSGGGGSGATASALVPTSTVPVWGGLSIAAGGTLTIEFDANVSSNVPQGIYQNEIIVSGSVPSLIFDYTATTQEDVEVCETAPPITAPAACANSTGNVASIALRTGATYLWSINNGSIITSSSTTTVNSVTIGSGGSGYGTAPTVSFSGGGGTGAAATATLTGDVVTAITITNPGSGYTSAPTVSFSGGGGSGATAAAVLGTGIIYTAGTVSPTISVTITDGNCSDSTSTVASVVGPVVTTQPTDKTYCVVNSDLVLTVTASGVTAYQWERSIDGGTSWANAPDGGLVGEGTGTGATTASYTYRAGVASSGYMFRVVMTGSGCSVTSSAVTITNSCNPDLQMLDSASPNPVTAGENITFTQSINNVATQPTNQSITMWQPIPTNTTFVSMTPPANWVCSNTTDGVISVAVTAGGSGYTSAPTVTFGGPGSGAAGFATIVGGVVTAVTITDPGSGYTSAPTVTLTGDGSGATATATVGSAATCTLSNVFNIAASANSGTFTFVVKVNADAVDGSTITDTPRVTTSNDANVSNNLASASVTVQRRIDVQTSKDDNAFVVGYGSHFIYPGNPAAPQNLTWTVAVANGGPSRASNVVITDPMPFGFTYSSSNISGAGNSCSFSAGTQILTCTIPTLDTTPTITFSGGGGTGAAAVATVSGGNITSIRVTNGGSGYTSAPTVAISTNGPGSGATATATVTDGVVTGVTITDAGTNYNDTPVINVLGQTTIDTTQIINSVTVAYTETDTNAANDASSDYVLILAPTLVKMLTMDATQWNNKVTITWRTSYEQDNLGFYVWRQLPDGTKQKISDRMILGSALISGRKFTDGRSYQVTDNDAPTTGLVQYYVEDVDLNTVHTMHGPITPRAGQPNSNPGGQTDTDPSIGSVGGIFTTAPGMGVSVAAPTGTEAPRLAQQWKIAESTAVKLVVTREGWYRVKKSDLVAAGFDPGNSSSRISVFTEGIEVPISIPSGTFGTNDAIEFYGFGLDTPTAGGRIYYVTNATGQGLRIDTSNVSGGGAAPPANYPYTFNRVERMLYFSAYTDDGSRDNFYGQLVWAWPSVETLTVGNIDPNGGDATLEIALQGVTDNYKHDVSVVLNGHELGPIHYKNQENPVTRISVPQAWLVAGDNNLTLTATNGWDDVSVVDYIRLSYAHQYRAESNALSFTMPGSTAGTVSGFSANAAAIKVIDLTNAQAPVQLAVNVTSATDGTKSVSFTTIGNGTRTLLAVADDRVQTPAQVLLNQPSKLNVTSNKADLVIITHRNFTAAANTIKAAREAQGITTMVVDVQNVYDEFGYGAHGPQPIRDMLKYASTKWVKAPKYVILFGDASWDPRNYMGFANIDFMPTKLVATTYLKTASDDWFVDFNDNDSPVMAIGRLPVQTVEQATAVANKLARRSAAPSGPWATTVEIITDRNTGGVPFNKGGDHLAALTPASLTIDRIDIGTNSNPTEAITNAFNRGSLLTNYIGHGSVEIWSNYVFGSWNAATLTNGDKLPFVVSMNCLNGYFHDMFTESLGEALLKSPNGGAIGVLASSALTSPDQQMLVNLELYRQLFGATSTTIGDAVLKAKQATQDRDVRRTFILIGDPTVRLR